MAVNAALAPVIFDGPQLTEARFHPRKNNITPATPLLHPPMAIPSHLSTGNGERTAFLPG
jgi:hypothetical protein